MTPLLQAADAAFRYPWTERPVGPFSLSVNAGELHSVQGPSGCGKSTLARMLSGLIPHLYRGELSGTVRALGQRTADVPLWKLSGIVGCVGQNPAGQLLAATVRDEIVFGLESLGLSAPEIEGRVAAALEAFGLDDMAEREPHTLSGGEQQKLVLAAIAARRPRVLVLDEALSMLDAASVHEVIDHVNRVRSEGTAVVAFEHRSRLGAHCDDAQPHVLARAVPEELPLPEIPAQIAPFRINLESVGVVLRGRRVLHEVELSLSGGQVIAVVGANGAGKTTLLRTLAGLQAHSGAIDHGSGRRPRLGLCFQNPDQQIFNPTVREEIRFGNTAIDERLYECALEVFGLAPYESTPPLLLSEGEKKRLGLATLLTRPGLCGLCLDEPTQGQDDQQRHAIGRVVRHLAAAGYLCVVATHDLEWVAQWCDAFVVLDEGRIVEHRDVSLREAECRAAL